MFQKIVILALAPMITSLFFRILEKRRELNKLVATLLALKNECIYNKQHRGNKQSKFQIYWLEQAMSLLAFYEYCPKISEKCLETYELAKDANCGQLERRKINGVSMVPGHVQDKMINIAEDIENILFSRFGLQNKTKCWKYCLYGIILVLFILISVMLLFPKYFNFLK